MHRWSDAKSKCGQNSFLAKIKNSIQLSDARKGFIEYQNPKQYWIGLKYSTQKKDFEWADGSIVTWSANMDTIVNKAEQAQPDFDKRCYLLTDGVQLVAAKCDDHNKYICQTGEAEEGRQSSSIVRVFKIRLCLS